MAQWQILGWMNVVLVLFMGSIYPVKEKMKTHRKLIPVYQKLRVIHPITGIVIMVVAIIHGFMALGRVRIHSGSLIVLVVMAMALTALAGPKIKTFRKSWRKIHRALGLLVFLLLLAHLMFPWWL